MGGLRARAAGGWEVLDQLGLRGVLEKSRRRRRDNRDYARWLAGRETPPPRPRPDELEPPPGGPLVSVLLPTCESDPRWLRRALDSVRAQSYPHWELCVADDASARPVREALAAAAAADRRIRLAFRPTRGHISAASNTALELARGRFVALLDHDDELAADALLEVARALARCPDADLLYSDEDKLDRHGRRSDPYFKPDFSPDLLLSQNLVSHLGVYRTELVRGLGGFRPGLEGAQDHDLALRVVEQSSPGRVVHLPRVLYHWRESARSASGGLWRKPWAHQAGCRAIADHLVRVGSRGRVERALYSAYRVRYELPQPAPGVATVAALRDAAGLNEAVRRSQGEVVVLLGAGCLPSAGAVEELVAQALRPEVGVAGGKLVSRSHRVLHAGHLLALERERPVLDAHAGEHEAAPGHFGRAGLVQNFLSVSAAAMAFRREVFDALGGFAAEAFPRGLFGVDFCLRVRERGLRVVFTPGARVVCRQPAAPAVDDADERARLRERWLARVPTDPYWHPAMDRGRADFRLAL